HRRGVAAIGRSLQSRTQRVSPGPHACRDDRSPADTTVPQDRDRVGGPPPSSIYGYWLPGISGTPVSLQFAPDRSALWRRGALAETVGRARTLLSPGWADLCQHE